MCLGVTRPFLLSLAAFPANSRISAGGKKKKKQAPFNYIVIIKKNQYVLFSIQAKKVPDLYGTPHCHKIH